jgi:TolB-like protein
MARSTVFSYKGKEVDPRKVGKELNVRAVLTGSVAQRGDTLNIKAELVNGGDGHSYGMSNITGNCPMSWLCKLRW